MDDIKLFLAGQNKKLVQETIEMFQTLESELSEVKLDVSWWKETKKEEQVGYVDWFSWT